MQSQTANELRRLGLESSPQVKYEYLVDHFCGFLRRLYGWGRYNDWLGSFDVDGSLIVETTTLTLTPDEYEALEPQGKEGYVEKDNVYDKTTPLKSQAS